MYKPNEWAHTLDQSAAMVLFIYQSSYYGPCFCFSRGKNYESSGFLCQNYDLIIWHSEELGINLDHLGFFNKHQHLSTRGLLQVPSFGNSADGAVLNCDLDLEAATCHSGLSHA